MRRLLRWCISGLCLLSLLACLETAWLWRHSYRPGQHRLHLRLRGERYGLRSEGGRVVLLALPPARSASQAAVSDWLGQHGNADFAWRVGALSTFGSGPTLAHPNLGPWFVLGGHGLPAEAAAARYKVSLVPSVAPDALRPIFNAMDEPERYVAAHVMLSTMPGNNQSTGTPPGNAYRRPGRQQLTAVFNGLRLDLPPQDDGSNWHPSPHYGAVYLGPAAGYDPSQMPALRDFWFDQLAVPLCSIHYGALLAVTAMIPADCLAFHMRRSFVRRLRRRLRLCLHCGYDLTGNTSGRCPECGAEPTATGTACLHPRKNN